MDIYAKFETFENARYLLREVKEDDCSALAAVYGDKNALPFFNSDNCDGDNFYYPTEKRMAEAMAFWRMAYDNKWFARWAIADKRTGAVIGTVELCKRASDDVFDTASILRIDVKSECEKADVLCDVLDIIVRPALDMFGSDRVITKAPIYAVERIAALDKFGFKRSEHLLIGKTGYAYDGYWTFDKERPCAARIAQILE